MGDEIGPSCVKGLEALVAMTVVTALAGAFGCDGSVPQERSVARETAALTMPDYGQTITIDFKADAAGIPLSRATVLAEQYAAAGVHFQGGFILGDRAFDFSDFHTSAPDNLICAGPRSDGRCAGGATWQTTNLVVTFDFPVCAVAIAGLGIPNSLSVGVVGVKGYDAAGNLRSGWSSRSIVNTTVEGRKFGWIPPRIGDYPGPMPSPTLDVRRLEVAGTYLGALDDLVITRCNEVVPRCKPALVCVPEGTACVSSTPVSIDDGSYSAAGTAVTLTQSPAGPFTDGPIDVTLTASDGVDSQSCTSTVRVGHCDVAQIDCPASEIAECATRTSGLPETRTCTPYSKTAYASDGCREASLGPVSPQGSPCIPPGVPTAVDYVANDLRGAAHKCTTTVTFVDRTPPYFPVVGNFKELTPADGQMYTFTLADFALNSANDACELTVSGPQHIAIACVTADEPSDGSFPDIEIVDATTFKVRASRDPNGDGRIYKVTAVARDSAGHVSEPGFGSIGVPRDGLVQYVDSGVHQEVCRPIVWPTGGAGGAGGGTGSGGSTAMGGASGNGSGGTPAQDAGTSDGCGTSPDAGGGGGTTPTGGATAMGGAGGSDSGGAPAQDAGAGGSGGPSTGGGSAGNASPGTGGRAGAGGHQGEGAKGGPGHSRGCAVVVTSTPSSPLSLLGLAVWAALARRRLRRRD
ncbi:MAG TPA: hypothetical protein VHU40_07765 [Polyangia bacterium]|jgi:MYXO-CTERM domain-containing protein|nr:hypothetical protein [Polyangia bacterium]